MRIRVLIDNGRARFEDLNDEQRKIIRDVLSFKVPRAHYSPLTKWTTDRNGKRHPPKWDGRKRYFSRDGCPVRLFLATRDRLKRALGCKFTVNLKGITYLDFSDDETQSDREYQNKAVAAMMSTPVGGLVIAATGSGKTYTAALYFRKFNNPSIFVVDELQLLYQTQRELAAHLDEPVGIIGHGKWKPERITVVMIQTLQWAKMYKDTHQNKLYKAWVKTIDVVLIDEIHVQINKRNFRVLQDIKPLVCFGLTATLQMDDEHIAMPAWEVCGPVLYEFPLEVGTKAGYLATGTVFHLPYTSEGLAHGGTYHEFYKDLIVENQVRNGMIIELTKAAIRRGHRVIIALDMPDHVELLSRWAHRMRISHRAISGRVTPRKRISYCQEFEDGDVPLLIVNRVFKKGINLKTVTFMVDGAGLGNLNDAIQKYGRGVRTSEGKEGLIYVDIKDQLSRAGVRSGRKNTFTDNARLRHTEYKKAGIHCVTIPFGLPIDKEMVRIMERRLTATIQNML